MAKRRRKKPNISQAALEQARQDVPQSAIPKPTADAPVKPRRRRRDLQAAQLEKRKSEGVLDAEYVADLLANPNKAVSEADLRADYSFVMKDLRSMGLLAAVLFVVLILISLIAL